MNPHSPAGQALAALIGQPGSRWRIPTPALVLDLDAAEANIQRMAQRAAAAGLALRPHAKSHKCAAIARLQLAAGAVGQCCAKLGEAEALAAAGVRGLLITSPLVGEDSAARAAALATLDPGLTLALDHPDQLLALDAAALARGLRLRVLVDVDVGLHRTGVASVADALALAQAMAAAPGLQLVGVQGYGGQWQHLPGAALRAAAVAQGMAHLAAVVAALRDAGHAVPLVTGGGTGSFASDAALRVLTEVQPGSYVFMDRQYRDALGDDPDGQFAHSLTVQARVISINAADHVTTDAGLKAFSTDGPLPQPVGPRFGACRYAYFGDEQGRLSRPAFDAATDAATDTAMGPASRPTPVPGSDMSPGPADISRVALGERVELIPPHCDPTVDRYDALVLVRGDVVVGLAPLEAARRAQ